MGLPFTPDITDAIAGIQCAVETWLPDWLPGIFIGTMEVGRVWLASYSHRTLCRIRGKVGLELGVPPPGTFATDLLTALGID